MSSSRADEALIVYSRQAWLDGLALNVTHRIEIAPVHGCSRPPTATGLIAALTVAPVTAVAPMSVQLKDAVPEVVASVAAGTDVRSEVGADDASAVDNESVPPCACVCPHVVVGGKPLSKSTH